MSKTTAQAETAAPPEALSHIIERAQVLARTREQLAVMVNALNTAIEGLKADALPAIRNSIDAAAGAWSQLEVEIKAHPELFVKPRSVEAHGIKFGYVKGKGGLEIPDPARTVELIHKHYPEQVELLVAVRQTPVKDAIAQLPAAQLKKIAVEVKDTGDVVFIKPAEGAVDKLVKALVMAAVGDE